MLSLSGERLPVVAGRSIMRSEPDVARTVFRDTRDHIADEAVRDREVAERGTNPTGRTLSVCPEPEVALAVFEGRYNVFRNLRGVIGGVRKRVWTVARFAFL